MFYKINEVIRSIDRDSIGITLSLNSLDLIHNYLRMSAICKYYRYKAIKTT